MQNSLRVFASCCYQFVDEAAIGAILSDDAAIDPTASRAVEISCWVADPQGRPRTILCIGLAKLVQYRDVTRIKPVRVAVNVTGPVGRAVNVAIDDHSWAARTTFSGVTAEIPEDTLRILGTGTNQFKKESAAAAFP